MLFIFFVYPLVVYHIVLYISFLLIFCSLSLILNPFPIALHIATDDPLNL